MNEFELYNKELNIINNYLFKILCFKWSFYSQNNYTILYDKIIDNLLIINILLIECLEKRVYNIQNLNNKENIFLFISITDEFQKLITIFDFMKFDFMFKEYNVI